MNLILQFRVKSILYAIIKKAFGNDFFLKKKGNN